MRSIARCFATCPEKKWGILQKVDEIHLSLTYARTYANPMYIAIITKQISCLESQYFDSEDLKINKMLVDLKQIQKVIRAYPNTNLNYTIDQTELMVEKFQNEHS